MIYFTSDTHFGHKNIIKYCGRPFADVEEMNRELVLRWNARVNARDTVYHLGDFAFLGKTRAAEILQALNGDKVLIIGNHDPSKIWRLPWWAQAHDALHTTIEGTPVFMFHYPCESWAPPFIHLHGHAHGTSGEIKNRYDVGVDAHGAREPFPYAPKTLKEIL